ncbi:MAG: hypothetical protein AB1807_15090 [Pseudomonadota bacterium]
MSKPEYPMLLAPGFHRFSLSDLPHTFVTPFATSQRRPILLTGLKKFLDDLAALAIKGDLWFDGSFVTEKSDPDDIDLVVVLDPVSIEGLSPQQQLTVQQLFDNPSSKAKYNCDVYCVLSTDVVWVSYWRGWFGFKRDGRTPKGIGFISL